MGKGLKVKIEPYKSSAGEKERVLTDAVTETPRIIGFSLIFQRMLPDFSELMKLLRSNGIKSHFTIGGHFPTIEPAKTLELMPELDTVIRHEGEITLWELYSHLDSPETWPGIRGLAFRSGSSSGKGSSKSGNSGSGRKIEITPPRPLIGDLDSIPFPVRREQLETHRGLGVCSILASRGCFFNCSFCSIRQFYNDAIGPRRRMRSPSNVVEEMASLFKRNVRIFKFVDDDFGMKSKQQNEWLNAFADELEDKGIANQILWRTSCRVDELELSNLNRMREVGMAYVYLGIESGCEQGLKTCNKRFSVKQVYGALDLIESAKLKFDYGFMLLDPDSTFDTIREDIIFLRELSREGRVSVHFTKMFPYVGTPIAYRLAKEGRLEGNLVFPNYKYLDPRLNVFEFFLSLTFHEAIFEGAGVVNKLQMFRFDSEVIDRFFPDRFDSKEYAESVRRLTQRYNESVLETLELTLNFMGERNYEEILSNWGMLQFLSQQELSVQSEIGKALDSLRPKAMNEPGKNAMKGSP